MGFSTTSSNASQPERAIVPAGVGVPLVRRSSTYQNRRSSTRFYASESTSRAESDERSPRSESASADRSSRVNRSARDTRRSATRTDSASAGSSRRSARAAESARRASRSRTTKTEKSETTKSAFSASSGALSATTDAVSSRAKGIGAFAGKHRRLLTALAVILVTVVALYGPACDYYAAWRVSLDLQATYDATIQSNEELTGEVQNLTTTEGIQDEARERGYVSEGETGVVVEGLEEDDDSAQTMGSGTSVTADVPWYIHVADVIFGYEAS
jgi:cell division protein FtsB